MTSDVLTSRLETAGWGGFGPDEFLGVEFDVVGKAKIARNNWFVLLRSIPVLDAAGLETWSDHYARFRKKARSGMFTSGKYFVLILLVDSLAADAAARLSEETPVAFLEIPEEILNGGGYTILVLRDRKQILMPKKIVLWKAVRATEFARRTNQAVFDYVHRMLPAGSGPEGRPSSGMGTVVAERFDR